MPATVQMVTIEMSISGFQTVPTCGSVRVRSLLHLERLLKSFSMGSFRHRHMRTVCEAGDERKAAHPDLEGVLVAGDYGVGSKADMLSAQAELDAQQLPVSYTAQAPAATDAFAISTHSPPASKAAQETSPYLINCSTDAVPSMRERPSGAASICSRGSAGQEPDLVQQPDQAHQADLSHKPSLARKKSVRFAEDDPAAAHAAAVACSGAAAPGPERPPPVAERPGREAERLCRAPERPAFCWSLLDNFAPGDLLDAQLDTGASSTAAEEVCEMERGRWRLSMHDGGVEPELGFFPRRSEDLRMADRATLPMAAFGGTGMETSAAVIRTLQATHEGR